MRGPRWIACIPLLLVTAGAAEASWADFRRRLYGRESVARVVASAAWGEARNAPHEWTRSGEGFGKRLASAEAGHLVKISIGIGVAEARHETLGYHPLRQGGFKRRLKYALLSTIITTKTTNGDRTAAAGRIAGDFGSGLLSRLWQPVRLHTWTNGFETGGISLGLDAAGNVAWEFWPEIRHPHKHRDAAASKASGASGK